MQHQSYTSRVSLITEEMIQQSQNTLFIFGDNLEQRGLGGQAKIARPFVSCGKAFGIPTKRKPTMSEDAFFRDRIDEMASVQRALEYITTKKKQGITIIFFPHIGEGLAKLPEKSPIIYDMIQKFIKTFDLKNI